MTQTSKTSQWPPQPSYSADQPIEEIKAILRRELPKTDQKFSQDITIRLPHEMVEFLENRAIEHNHNTLGATVHLMLLEWQCMKKENEES